MGMGWMSLPLNLGSFWVIDYDESNIEPVFSSELKDWHLPLPGTLILGDVNHYVRSAIILPWGNSSKPFEESTWGNLGDHIPVFQSLPAKALNSEERSLSVIPVLRLPECNSMSDIE